MRTSYCSHRNDTTARTEVAGIPCRGFSASLIFYMIARIQVTINAVSELLHFIKSLNEVATTGELHCQQNLLEAAYCDITLGSEIT